VVVAVVVVVVVENKLRSIIIGVFSARIAQTCR
jgi:hypothetical protein